MHNSFCTVQQLQRHRIGLDLTDAQLCGITPGNWQLRVSGPVISLNANCTLSPVVASRAVSWARRHRNIRRLFSPDCSSSMSSTSLGSPLAQVGTCGPRKAFHQKITRAAGSVAVVATERSDADREQTCFAASHLFYCEVDGARSS